jgi:hypothetical protein
MENLLVSLSLYGKANTAPGRETLFSKLDMPMTRTSNNFHSEVDSLARNVSLHRGSQQDLSTLILFAA